MRQAIGIGLALALLSVIGSHVLIVVSLARRREGVHALMAILVPPLAPAWALERGMRAFAWTWLIGFFVYAVLVAAS